MSRQLNENVFFMVETNVHARHKIIQRLENLIQSCTRNCITTNSNFDIQTSKLACFDGQKNIFLMATIMN